MEQNNARVTDTNMTKGIFEAYLGALSLETTYDNCYKFLITLIENEIDYIFKTTGFAIGLNIHSKYKKDHAYSYVCYSQYIPTA